jgi:glycerol transport system ATP-binding protein
VRPEFVRLAAGGDGAPVTVQRIDDIGRHKVARVQLDRFSLNVLAAENAEIDGDAARIVFDPDHVHLYRDGHLMQANSG